MPEEEIKALNEMLEKNKATNGRYTDTHSMMIVGSQLMGFGIKVTPNNRKVFFLYYRTKDGVQRKPTIGQFGTVKIKKAREIASGWLQQVLVLKLHKDWRTQKRQTTSMGCTVRSG